MSTSDSSAVVRYLDVLLVVLAAPFVVLMGAPVAGYVAGAAAWIGGRIVGVALERWARAHRDARGQVGSASRWSWGGHGYAVLRSCSSA